MTEENRDYEKEFNFSPNFQDEKRFDFKIYDMPTSVADRLIEYTKKKAGNKAWVAIYQLLEQRDMEKKINRLEAKLVALEKRVSGKEFKDKSKDKFKSIGGDTDDR